MEHEGNNLIMVRGDSEKLHVRLFDNDKNLLLKDTDILEFTVRRRPTSEDRLISKRVSPVNGEAIFEILPSDTAKLKFKTYVYDIQVTEEDGTVTTLVKCADFTIDKEVTY